MRYLSMKNSICCLVFVFTISCTPRQKPNDTSSTTTDTTSVQVIENDALMSKVSGSRLSEINQLLYDKFLSGNYGPHPVKNDSGYVVLDVQGYRQYLDNLNIFTQDFVIGELGRVSDCEHALLELKYVGDMDLGWAPRACSFFDYLYWVQSQEKPSTYTTSKMQFDEADRGSCDMKFVYSSEAELPTSGLVTLIITYRLQANEWRIDAIKKEKV